MLISNEDAKKRLDSPSNLLNRLRRSPGAAKTEKAMSIFIPPTEVNDETAVITPINTPTDEINPAIEAILDDIDDKVREETIKRAALGVLGQTVAKLAIKMNEIDKPKELADVATKMSKIVNEIKNGSKDKERDNKTVHLHFYTPERKQLKDFEVVDV